MSKRPFGLAVAQMGPVQPEETRRQAVARLLAMMREAHARGAKLVVFPELALTTFFPRYWMTEEEAMARYFEKEMPGPDTRILFDTARELGIGFYLGYAEIASDGRRFNTSILVDTNARIVGRYRKIHLPGHSDHKPQAPFSIWKRNSLKSATTASTSGKPWAHASACVCATTAAGRKPGACWRCKAPKSWRWDTTRRH